MRYVICGPSSGKLAGPMNLAEVEARAAAAGADKLVVISTGDWRRWRARLAMRTQGLPLPGDVEWLES